MGDGQLELDAQPRDSRATGSANPDPFRVQAYLVAALLTMTGPLLMVGMRALAPEAPKHPWAEVAVRLGVEPSQVSLGELVFRSSCAVCHGREAQGIPRLGKPLRNSAYVQAHTNEELFQLIATGRPPTDPENTTGSVMPPRANQNLRDEQLRRVILYLRAIQDPTQPTVSLDQWIVETTEQSGGAQVAGLVGAATGVGHDLFIASCSACHGATGEGMEGLGKPLASSPFVDSKTNEELIAFLKTGRPIWDPANTTGVDMPPKGGNPALSEEQLGVIVEYLRALHQRGGESAAPQP